MAGIPIEKPVRKRLTAAITVASGVVASSLATAGTYTATLSGAIVDQQDSVLGVPGVSSAPMPPAYQKPVLVPYGGPGWAAELTLSIDSNTGEVTAFEERTTAGYIEGAGGNIAGRYPPGHSVSNGQNFPSPLCEVTSANPGETGTIVYTCPLDFYGTGFIDYAYPGYQCITPNPSSTDFLGINGCGNHNAGVTFPGGIPNYQNPEPTNGAHIAVPAASGLSPFPLVNPAFYASNDPQQYFNGMTLRPLTVSDSSAQLNRNGVDFTIHHSGTFADFNFSISSVEFINRSRGTYNVGPSPLPPGELESFNQSQYNTLTGQTFTPSTADQGKPVPAMGAFGLMTLLMGLTGIAGRLITGRV